MNIMGMDKRELLAVLSSKKERKGKQGRLYHKFGIILAVAMTFQMLSFEGITVLASENRGGRPCEHHAEHTEDCGYIPATEDGEGNPCSYECPVCPIEEMIAALPDVEDLTEDNRAEVQARLEEILALFGELTEEEQGQVDAARCSELQAILDGGADPAPALEEPDLPSVGMARSALRNEGLDLRGVTSSLENHEEGWKWEPGQGGGGTLTLNNCHIKGNIMRDDGKTLLPWVIRLPDSESGGDSYEIVLEGDNVIESMNPAFGAMILDSGGMNLTITGNGSLTLVAPSGGDPADGSYAVAGNSLVIEEGVTIRSNVSICMVNRSFILRGGSVTLEGEYVYDGVYVNAGDVTIEGGTLNIQAGRAGMFLPGIGRTPMTNNVKISGGTVNISAPHAIHTQYYPDREDGEKIEITGGEIHLNANNRSLYGKEITVGENAKLNVQVSGAAGLIVLAGEKRVAPKLAAGTYSGNGTAISIVRDDISLADLLEEGYAFYDESGNLIFPEDGQKELPGTVTVKKCEHSYQYDHTDGAMTHSQFCQACGDTKSNEKCRFDETGNCPCGAVLEVRLPDVLDLAYNGIEQKPAVTVAVDGQTLAEDKYTVSYANNINVGVNTAIVKVTSDAFIGTVQKTFSIKKADVAKEALAYTPPSDLTYTGQPKTATVTADGLTGLGEITVRYKKDNAGVLLAEAKDAGTYYVYAVIAEGTNYNAAEIGAESWKFTIAKAPGRDIENLTGTMALDSETETYTYTISPIDGAVYRCGDGAWSLPGQTDGNIFKGIAPGTSVTFSAKMPETENYLEGTTESKEEVFPKLTPTASPALSYTRKTDEETGKVTLAITPVSGAEYSFDNGQSWTDSNVENGLDPSRIVTLAIRLKETATHNPSPAQTVTVNLAKGDRTEPPAFTLLVEPNGETDYTVTIPATEGCEYSFDGVTWSDTNSKTGVNAGETVTGYKRYKETDDYNASNTVSAKDTMEKFTVKTPVISPAGGSYAGSVSVTIACASPNAVIYYTIDGSTPGRGSARYTGTFTVIAPATVKAMAVKEGMTDSAVATAAYAKQESGQGGNSGSGGSDSNGGNASSQMPALLPAAGTQFGESVSDGGLGTGKKSRPGDGTGRGDSTAREGGAQRDGEPFIKGKDGKTGWDVIRAEEERAEEGSTIHVDMNGSTVVPADIFDSIKGRDVTVTFDMGGGILWSVDRKSVTTDRAEDIDFSVKTGENTVPVDIVNNVTGENYSIQLSLSHEGDFGFTAVLSIGLGKENAGLIASLYYYNESSGELEFISRDQIAEDGTASLVFTHASDYVIAIHEEAEEENNAAESAPPEGVGGAAEKETEASSDDASGSVRTGQTGMVWWIIGAVLLVAVVCAGMILTIRKRQEDEDEKS